VSEMLENMENKFFVWLKSNLTPFALEEMKASYKIINTILLQRKILPASLFVLKDVQRIVKAKQQLDKVFANKKLRVSATKLLNAYAKFLKEKNTNESEVVEIQKDWIRYNYYNAPSFARTYPVYCSIDGVKFEGKNWARILVAIVEHEIAKNAMKLQPLCVKPLADSKNGQPFFLKEKMEKINCAELSNGYWININYGIPALIKLIESFCLYCGYKRNQIILYGIPKAIVREAHEADKTIKATAKESMEAEIIDSQSSRYLTSINRILTEKFPKGYRIGSAIDMMKMRRYYKEETGNELTVKKEILETKIKSCGIEYDGKIYVPKTMLKEEAKGKLFAYITDCFAKGKSTIYYQALYQEFYEDLLDSNLYNPDMLKTYLAYFLGDCYYFGRSYLAPSMQAVIEPIEEIRQVLLDSDAPVAVEDLCSILSHISRNRILTILSTNGEFVRNSKGEYFHADCLKLTDDELAGITEIIKTTITEQKFISGNELYDAIRQKYPDAYDKNNAYSLIGWRDALKYRLSRYFSFTGNIISRRKAALSMSDVFAGFAKTRKRFTLDELDKFAESLSTNSTGSYIGAVYPYVVRVSYQDFVPKNEVHFQVKKTDAVLAKLCQGNYMPLYEVSESGLLPEASHPWTVFLLQQYVAFYSKVFYLQHGGFGKNNATGAMVKRTFWLENFDDFITEVLAESGLPLEKQAALNYLAEQGYIARRSYTNMETLLLNARAKRNQKKEND